MSTHRPLITRYGNTHCICGVFCGAGRNIAAWQSHVDDRVLLDGSAEGINPAPIGEAWWSMMRSFQRIAQAQTNAVRKIAQAFEGVQLR